jgi:transposase
MDGTDASPEPETDRAHHPHHARSTVGSNNVSERGAKVAKRHKAVSGYWHSLATLACGYRIRTYLDSAAAHGITALDAIRDAIVGKPSYRHSRHRLMPVHGIP